MKVTYVIFFAFLCIASIISAQNKTALLIANGAYSSFSSLANPVPEANELKATLEKLEFQVTLIADASKEEILDSIIDFEETLRQRGGIAFFHYGGHAVQVDGRNYLIPADANIPDERRVVSRAVDSDEIMAAMESSGCETTIVILDSCRNNPLPAGTNRSSNRGLAMVGKKPPNSIIVYSAESGTVAQDGIFTPTLIQALQTPGLSLQEMLMQTRQAVYNKTGGKQIPGEYNQLFTPIYFAPVNNSLSEFNLGDLSTSAASLQLTLAEDGILLINGNEIEIPAGQKLPVKGLSPGSYVLYVIYSDGYREKKEIKLESGEIRNITFKYNSQQAPREGFVLVHPGSFLMGSPEDELNRSNDETQHQVTLSRGFYIAETEVTQGLWEEVMGTSINQQRDKHAPAWRLYGTGTHYPMYYIDWDEAVEFCNKLSLLDGLTPCYKGNGYTVQCDFDANGYRLPTEAEWEYAARGGHKAQAYQIYAGSNEIQDYGWYELNSFRRLREVAQKMPNILGLYDMTGNVEEWCWDWYSGYGGSLTDPKGPSLGYDRVFRGGDFNCFAMDSRVAHRNHDSPASYGIGLGFRVVRNAN